MPWGRVKASAATVLQLCVGRSDRVASIMGFGQRQRCSPGREHQTPQYPAASIISICRDRLGSGHPCTPVLQLRHALPPASLASVALGQGQHPSEHRGHEHQPPECYSVGAKRSSAIKSSGRRPHVYGLSVGGSKSAARIVSISDPSSAQQRTS